MGEIMINRIVLTRIEPCFKAAKPACGELSRVKKDNTNTQINISQSSGTDTFTSSKENKEVNSEKYDKNKINNDKRNAQ